MRRLVVRVWLPDRPGALGRVASALGEADISLIGIEIIEQGGGSAIDELVVDAPGDEASVVRALESVDGVHAESHRPPQGALVDPRVDALETAAELVEQIDRESLAAVLVARAHHDLAADWVVLVDETNDTYVASAGTVPALPWVKAFVAGSRSADVGRATAQDIAWADISALHASLVLGREGSPFRPRERAQIAALARIAEHLWSHLHH